MDRFTQECQIETIKQQCHALTQKGCAVSYQVHKQPHLSTASITVFANNKMYHFSDPDLNVIIQQLCTLHQTLTTNRNHVTDFISLILGKKCQN